MDSTQHDRGWELAADDGFLSVSLVNEMSKDASLREQKKKSPKGEAGKKEKKEEVLFLFLF